MADTIISAVQPTTPVATPASTDAAASTQSTCSTPLDKLMAHPANAVQVLTEACQAVRANELARLAALSLGQVSRDNLTFEWVPLALADCSNAASNNVCAAAEQGNNPWSTILTNNSILALLSN